SWALLANLLRLGLWLGGIDNPLRARIVAGAVIAIAVPLLLWGFIEATRVPRVRNVSVALPRLPDALHGLRVVQLSDLHYGPFDRSDWSRRVVAAVNALGADIVCITGDIADGRVNQRRKQTAALAAVRARLARV